MLTVIVYCLFCFFTIVAITPALVTNKEINIYLSVYLTIPVSSLSTSHEQVSDID